MADITVRGKFKSCNLFNQTLHIILYPDDGLRAAVQLQELEEGTDMDMVVKAFTQIQTTKQKPSICTACGKSRIIEFVCLFGMDDASEPRAKKRELCKECTTDKNKCRHTVCRANYRDRLDP